MTPVVLKRRVFNNHGGMSPARPTPKRYAGISHGLPFYSQCYIRIILPPRKQLSRDHPRLVRRLVANWKEGLEVLGCSSGNFKKALMEGDKITLSHIWAEAYCLWLDAVSVQLDHGHISFAERFDTVSVTRDMVETRVMFFFSEPFSDDFGGLEYKVTGYLNCLYEGRPYDIKKRIREFVVYRLAHPEKLAPSKPSRGARKEPRRRQSRLVLTGR